MMPPELNGEYIFAESSVVALMCRFCDNSSFSNVTIDSRMGRLFLAAMTTLTSVFVPG